MHTKPWVRIIHRRTLYATKYGTLGAFRVCLPPEAKYSLPHHHAHFEFCVNYSLIFLYSFIILFTFTCFCIYLNRIIQYIL